MLGCRAGGGGLLRLVGGGGLRVGRGWLVYRGGVELGCALLSGVIAFRRISPCSKCQHPYSEWISRRTPNDDPYPIYSSIPYSYVVEGGKSRYVTLRRGYDPFLNWPRIFRRRVYPLVRLGRVVERGLHLWSVDRGCSVMTG
jgi:hypothetical protein